MLLKTTDAIANPAPLGLFGFGMTTILLNIHNAGFYELNSMILAMGICYGGLAQIIAGILEAQKNNTFGLTAFTSYGFFWLSLVALIVMPELGWIPATSKGSLSIYLLTWGIFTAFLFIGTFKLSRALQLVFGSLTILFLLLALADFTANQQLKVLAGVEGILCGLLAVYTGLAILLNDLFQKDILPMGVVN
jgi:succinate-acetate transporter protein